MKKTFTFYDLCFKKRSLLLLILLLLMGNNAFTQTFCRPNSQTNSTGGLLCVGMSVSNPDDAFDGNMSTFASISNVLGLACFAQETINFSQTAKAGDQIVVYFNTGNGVLNAELLANGTIQAKNGVANVGPAVALSNGILNLQILDKVNNIGVIKYTLPGDANSVKIESGGLLSLLLSLRIYEVRLQFAKPTIVGGNSQSVCAGQSITLSATAATGTTVAWYDSPTSTTALSNVGTFTTPALTATTTYYVSSSRAAGCESDERVPVTVNVIEPVLPIINTTGTSICSSGGTQSTTLSVVNPVPGTTYSWYNTATGGTLLAPGNTFTTTVSIGVSNFWVEAAIGGCKTPTRTPVSVTSTQVPAVPTVLTQSVSILSGQNATLSASSSDPSVTFDWYDAATGGTKLLANSPTYTTPILTANKTYYVEAVSGTGGCGSARVAINVTVSTNPLGSCLDANSQQTSQNGLCLLCSSSNPNNSVDGNSSTASRLSVPAGLLNGSIQQTLQFNNPGQAGDVVTVDLELPTGLLDISALSYITLATYNGATYNNDRIAVNSSLLNVQLLVGNRFKASITAGSAFDRVEIKLGGLATLLTSLDIYGASYKFKARTITGNKTICSGQTATLTSSTSLGETINWYSALTGGTLLGSTAAYTTPALTANTTYYVEVTRNGCVNSERLPVLVTVNNPVAPAAVVPSPLNLCSGQTSTITVQSPVAGTNYNWYSAASSGTSLFTGISFTTPSLTTTTSYYVEAEIGSCLSPTRTQVTVNVSARPTVPTVTSSNVVIQAGQSVTLQVSNPVAGIDYDWYDAPVNGNLLASATTSYTPTPALTVNKSFYITARSTATDCTSDTRAVINVSISNSINSCLLANSQVTSRGGTTNCLLCGSTNDGASVDGNNTTAAHLSIPVGLLGDYMQQILSFPTAGQAGDIIDVELGIPVGLLDISVLSNIRLQSFNSGLPNADQSNISSLLNVQILGGNRFKASFVAAGPFTSVQVKLEGLASVLGGLDIYEASYRYPNATITGAATPICTGQSTTLTATATGTQTFSWYDVPTGGTALATNTNTYGTGALTGTKTFYLEASRGVTPCFNTNRQAITVTVLPIPTDVDIAIITPLTATCAGIVVLTPTSTLAGATFKYYTDQNKTQEIVSGTLAGVTYLKDATSGALTISGLIASNSPYKYYVSVLNAGSCENINGTLKEVVVNYPAGSALTVTATLAGCAKVNLKDAITNFDASGNTTYTFFDAANAPITDQAAANITIDGDYWIQAQTTGVACPSVKEKVTVTINPLPTLVVTTASEVVNKGISVPLVATSNGTVTWYDPAGNPIPSNNTGALNIVGVFTYTVIASNGTCTNSQTITISVIDPASCDPLLEREYATTQQWGTIITGTVTNGASGADGNPKTYSTITTGLGLLGIGTTWQNLQWPTTIAKGTPVTVKLGSEYSAVALGQSVTVVGTKRDGLGNPIDIGTLKLVSGSLLNLLSGQNSFEYTFVPSDISGPKAYDGIRVQLGSILSVAQSINVYDAYYDKTVTQITCGQGDIEDVFSGVKEIGVGALTATVGVSNAWNIADGDVATYATMFSGVGVLAAAQLTATFRTPSMVGDSLRITISKPGTVLNLNLLTGFSIQLYSGNIAVGAPIQNTSSLLTLKLLSGDTMAMTIVAPQTQPYDRVTISFGGVVSVLDQLRVHTIDRVTNTKVIGGDKDNMLTVCPGTDIKLEVPPQNCSTYKWYDSPTGGKELASGQTYTLPATLAAGTYHFYIQPIRYGCSALERGEVTVVVRPTTPASAIASIEINGSPNPIICATDGKVTLKALLSVAPVLTNPVYHWYSFDGTTSNLIAGETISTLNLTGLTAGTYTYSVGVSSDEYCESVSGDRKQVTFIILPNSLSTDISVDNSSICHDTDATLTPTSTLTNPVFYWYFDANKTQPIISSAIPVNGVTYTISNTGVLTVSGLTATMNPISYYVAVSSDNTCQNKEGELKMVTVTVSNPATPTTDDNTQEFCLLSNPTIADLQVNEGNVIWYDSLASTTALLPTTPLTSKIYYGAISIPIQLNPRVDCESAVRLAVTVTVNDPGTPIITKTVQDFCLVNAPTLANIDVSPAIAANIVWYDALTGGNLIATGTKLTNTTYYAAIKDPITLCESNVRLAITVNVTDPGTPVITKTTQDFCLVNAPTLANIDVSPAVAATIVWYDALTGGNLVAVGTKLTNRIYYAALKDPITLCTSNVRLAVTVNVTDPGTPTTADATQDFCLVNKPTVANLQVNEADVFWYTTSTGGTALASTTAIVNGAIYYGGFVDTATNCESAVRLEVAVSVTDPGTPTTGDTTQDFCLVNAPTVANIQVDAPTTGTIVWYTALTGGTVIPSTTPLANGSYYAAIKDPTTTCESNVRLAITIKVTDPGTPIITKTTQDFCLVNAPTLANIDVSPAIAANIVWYDALVGGNLVAVGTKLTNRIYYAALKDATTTCESNIRLAVTVNVTDPGTPTTADATQDFCLVNAPTVANIQVDTPTTGTIVWYNALTGGIVIAPTTVLTTGSYFAAIHNSTTNCESAVRLEVAVSVTDPGTPVITKTTQDFCLVNAPTLANIDVSPAVATNIVWYDALTGGNLIAAGTKLANTTYYAAIKDPTTLCESNVRLAITINVTDPGTPIITKTTQDFCLVNAPTLASIDVSPAIAANIVWYDALTGGNLVVAGTKLTSRIYYAAIKDATTTCESNVRLAVIINVTNPGTPTTVDATQDFCLVDAPTVADIKVDTPTTGTIVWYNALTGGTAIAPTRVLTTGSYFAAIHNVTTNCESAVRLEVAVSVTDPGTPTTGDTTQDFCLVNAPTVASIQVDTPTTGTIVWYTALTGGTVIPSATALTNGSYFASIHNSTTNCESKVRLEVVISITDPVTPTTTATTQVFCSGNNPTVASIQVNEANVVWYNAITGGTALNPTTALVSGDYFGVIKDLTTGCESSIRLKVTVTVGNTINPTTNNATQNFCSTAAPTVASIQVNESNVVWYTASTGGTVIPATTALASGIYFGNIIDPLTACESSTRLQVTVTVSDPSATPTTNLATQDFCSVNNPKVSDIQVNEANVVWYSTSTGGTVIPATTALVTGSYFGVVSNTAGCENPVRLEVKVNVNTPGVITTPRTAQTFCLTALPTIANILVNETNVVWYSSATGGTALATNTPLTATTYYAGALNNTTNGCDSATRLGVTISFENDALVQLASSDDTPCVFQEVTYSIANGKSNYVWSITNGTIVSGGGNADGSVTVSWSDIGPGKVEVTYTNNCDETTTKSLNVTVATCSDLTITKTVNNPTPNFGDDVIFTITVNNVGEGNFINTLVSELLPSGYDLVSSTVTAGTYDPATQVWTIPTLKAGESVTLTVTATVLHNGNYVNVATIEISTPLDVDTKNNSASASVDPICLVVYNEFTPNNDGANDLFRIDCIETYPNNELKVFNRYGALVYSQKHYENDWNGTANVSGVINRGDMLPTGTYFYVIDIGDGTVKKGWLSIMR